MEIIQTDKICVSFFMCKPIMKFKNLNLLQVVYKIYISVHSNLVSHGISFLIATKDILYSVFTWSVQVGVRSTKTPKIIFQDCSL